MRRSIALVLIVAFAMMLAPARAASPPPALASFPVPGASAASQRLIDEGVAMLYGFNGGEARAKFAAASKQQPELALPYALTAESYTIDINLPWTADTEKPGRAAVDKAIDAAAQKQPPADVQALIGALKKRFSGASGSDSTALCLQELKDFALELETFVAPKRNEPTGIDPNVFVIDGYALYGYDNSVDANPWNQPVCPPPSGKTAVGGASTSDAIAAAIPPVVGAGSECGSTEVKAAHLEDVRADIRLAELAQPWNLGAQHLSIHENEYASARPRHHDDWTRAIPDAEKLAANTYPPGLSHLSHMTGHIWTRRGEYERTIFVNRIALVNDHRYFTHTGPIMAGHDYVAEGQKYLDRYHTHDMDFVLYALTTVGRNAEAVRFTSDEYPDGRPALSVQLRLHGAVYTPHPPDGNIREPWRTQLQALAAARNGDAALARKLAAQLVAATKDHTLGDLIEAQLAPKYSLAAEQHYAAAYRCNKGAYSGDPKDYWMVPIGEGYAAVLLARKQYAQARDVLLAESARFPFDPHVEWGLGAAYAGLHQPQEASRWNQRYAAHWKGVRPLTLADLG